MKNHTQSQEHIRYILYDILDILLDDIRVHAVKIRQDDRAASTLSMGLTSFFRTFPAVWMIPFNRIADSRPAV